MGSPSKSETSPLGKNGCFSRFRVHCRACRCFRSLLFRYFLELNGIRWCCGLTRRRAMSHVLDERKPLRDSILWKLQAAFYDQINIRCWSDAIVPNFVTSNAFIANCYSRNILAFVRDWFVRCGCPHADS